MPLAAVLMFVACIANPVANGGQQALPLDPLARLRAYLVWYQEHLSSVVAEELYIQNYQGRKRTTKADLVMVRLPGNAGWIAFRDVFEVDQRSVRDREGRLLKLLQTPTSDALTQARRIADEGARFNLGPFTRTINVPDVALAYLHPSHRGQVTVDPPRPTTIDDVQALLFRFRETSRPSIITGPNGQDVPAQGRMWTDANGAILRTELTVNTRSSTAVCVVDFRLDERIGALVPSKMSERYTAGNQYVTATATYGNFRQFKVETAEKVGKPPGR
jgi:hypothetical protein